jgi:hypothetical protein
MGCRETYGGRGEQARAFTQERTSAVPFLQEGYGAGRASNFCRTTEA